MLNQFGPRRGSYAGFFVNITYTRPVYDEVTLESSSQLRVDTWRAIVDVVTEHPLDGVGFTGLGYVLPETGSALGVQVKDSAHSTYMRFLGEATAEIEGRSVRGAAISEYFDPRGLRARLLRPLIKTRIRTAS